MNAALILALALITYLSRAAALALLPRPHPAVERALARIPAPLFASLAAVSLVTPERGAAPLPVLAAAVGALLVAPRRSLLVALAGGAGGYLLGLLIA